MLPVDVVNKTISAIESSDIETTGIYLSADFEFHSPLTRPMDKSTFLAFIGALLAAVPNWAFNITDVQERGATVKIKTHITGTNTGEFNLSALGLPNLEPTGKRLRLPEEGIEFVVKRDKIVSIKFVELPGKSMSRYFEEVGLNVPVQVGA